jgi:bifunctional non-homologous end joining protein LigD
VIVPRIEPQLVANIGLRALDAAIAEPDRWAIEPKVDGVRGLIVYQPDGSMEARNRRGQVRDWFRHRPFRDGVLALADRLPILWQGTVLDGELTAGHFEGTMAALQGSRRFGPELRLVVFDVPILAGVDLRAEPWQARRERLELLARAFAYPLELSPIVEPARSLALDVIDGRLEGIVLKDREAPYRGGSHAGWRKVKDPRWMERNRWRFDRWGGQETLSRGSRLAEDRGAALRRRYPDHLNA